MRWGMKMPSPSTPLNIGTRGSPLALAQAYEVRARLSRAHDLPHEAFKIIVIKTTGDDRVLIDADRPLKEIGNKGLFTREIEEQLLAGSIDIAVHSMKDMPSDQPLGLVLDCYLPRVDVRDALVADGIHSLDDLPQGAVVGTSSLRRRAQLLTRRPDLTVVEFRGNVQTRLKKLHDGVARATFLAMAGLVRLDAQNVPMTPLEPDEMLPAVAQGAIGIERRKDDVDTANLLAPIHHIPTAHRLAAERAFLAALDGSCETPIAGLAVLDGNTLTLRGEILRPDGSQSLSGSREGTLTEGAALGRDLALDLKSQAGPDFFDWRTG